MLARMSFFYQAKYYSRAFRSLLESADAAFGVALDE
jgi:hypothetical protein